MLNLRTNRGLIFEEYQKRFNEDFLKKNQQKISQFVDNGLMVYEKDRIYLTYAGMMILDTIVMELLD